MGSTFVEFHGRGFEASDAALEVVLALLVQEIDHLDHPPSWLREARDEWELQATAGFGFGVMPGLDNFVTDEERRDVILRLLSRVIERLQSFGPVIPRETLNALHTGGEGAEFTKDAPADSFLRTARYLAKLLRGTLEPNEIDARFEI
jgi:hypothetical protein